jgi:hypothetical protein
MCVFSVDIGDDFLEWRHLNKFEANVGDELRCSKAPQL